MLNMTDQIIGLYASLQHKTDDKSVDTCTAIKDTLKQMATIVKMDRDAAYIPKQIQETWDRARDEYNSLWEDIEPGQQAFAMNTAQYITRERDEKIEELTAAKKQADSPEGSVLTVSDGVTTKKVTAFDTVNRLNDIALNNAHNITNAAYETASFNDIGNALAMPSTHRESVDQPFTTIDNTPIDRTNGSAKHLMHEIISQLENTEGTQFVNKLGQYSAKERSKNLLYNSGSNFEDLSVAAEELHEVVK